ncbi:hypothetical protein ACCO45_002890 [Purpureocillium lilacinum]|uniref:Uncharacterized protein n=1 Tax=Purpureocillium lilacinum TaxID=33203 RepID=A0ACC4DZN6_PURLI
MADSEPNAVQVSKTEHGITTITINRHHRRNAIDGPTARKLTDAFLTFEQDPSQKVCVFYGAHGTFCAGFDLHEVAKFRPGSDAAPGETYNGPIIDARHGVQDRNIGPIGPSRMQVSKPVICAAVVGLGRALDMILTGRPVSAQEALQMGLANRVVPRGEALREATRIAEGLLAFPQRCMNVDRASCYYAAYEARSFEDAMRHEFEEGAKVITTESVQGAARFASGAGRHGQFEKHDSTLEPGVILGSP